MATMLAYILTDIDIPRDLLRSLLAEAVGASFNAISVDSDQSTSDTVAMLSSGRVPFGDAQGKPIPVRRQDTLRLGRERGRERGEGAEKLICRSLAASAISAPPFLSRPGCSRWRAAGCTRRLLPFPTDGRKAVLGPREGETERKKRKGGRKSRFADRLAKKRNPRAIF